MLPAWKGNPAQSRRSGSAPSLRHARSAMLRPCVARHRRRPKLLGGTSQGWGGLLTRCVRDDDVEMQRLAAPSKPCTHSDALLKGRLLELVGNRVLVLMLMLVALHPARAGLRRLLKARREPCFADPHPPKCLEDKGGLVGRGHSEYASCCLRPLAPRR